MACAEINFKLWFVLVRVGSLVPVGDNVAGGGRVGSRSGSTITREEVIKKKTLSFFLRAARFHYLLLVGLLWFRFTDQIDFSLVLRAL